MNKTITVRCPLCNKTKSFDLGLKNNKNENNPVWIKDSSALVNGNLPPEFILISFTGCGHEFFVTNKKIIPFAGEILNQPETVYSKSGYVLSESDANNILVVIGAVQGKLNAIKFHKVLYGVSLKESKDFVEKILSEYGIKTKEGCFIATACYGDYDAEEVVVLRKYRDNVLMKSEIGRMFIWFYYALSPFLAKQIAKSEKAKFFIRKYILTRLIHLIGY